MNSLLERLSPGSLRLDLQTSSFEQYKQQPNFVHEEEPWFKLPLMHAPIPSSHLQSWEKSLKSAPQSTDMALPPRNVYIPTELAVIDLENGHAVHQAAAPSQGSAATVGSKRARESQVGDD